MKMRKTKKIRKKNKEKRKKGKRQKQKRTTNKQKHKQNANTTDKRIKKEIHRNPIYTNPIKKIPKRGDDLVRFSIAKLKTNCPKTLGRLPNKIVIMFW